MKVLVVGGSGVIGSKIVKHFIKNNAEVEFTYFKNNATFGKGNFLDITQKDSTIKLITKINPEIVIHATALANVDLCETDPILANSINVSGTTNVIEGCKMTKSKLVYISTSAVFDGTKKQYFEKDLVSPFAQYGITKCKGEKMVEDSGLSYLILRTDQPYCWIEKWQHTNSVVRVLQTLRSGKILKEIVDWYNTPTYVPDFVHATEKLLNSNETGIFHVVGPDFLNRYQWAHQVAAVFNLDRTMIEPINSDSLNLVAKRVNVNLSNQKLLHTTGIKMMNTREGAIDMLNCEPSNA